MAIEAPRISICLTKDQIEMVHRFRQNLKKKCDQIQERQRLDTSVSEILEVIRDVRENGGPVMRGKSQRIATQRWGNR